MMQGALPLLRAAGQRRVHLCRHPCSTYIITSMRCFTMTPKRLGDRDSTSKDFNSTSEMQSSSSPQVNTVSELVDAAALRVARDGVLKARLSQLQHELAEMEKVKALCDAAAQRHPDKRMKQLFVFLIVQAAVLFDWTYIHFDWNLVEPITYLIGYSATWIAIIWYGALQREFSYDTLRGMMRERQSRKLYAQHKLDVARYEKVKVEVAKLEKVLRSLEPL